MAQPNTQSEPPVLESLAYFDDGKVFEYKPLNFKSTFRFRLQSRAAYESEDARHLDPEIVNFNVRRMRLRYEGNVLDPRLLFRFQFSFTRGDMDFDRTEYPNILRDAVVGWRFSDRTVLWYGQTKLPGNRQRVVSSASLEFVDRSLVNATFNIDRDMGAQLHHRFGDSSPGWIRLAISNGEGRATDNTDAGLAYTARVEWLPLGQFKEGGDYFEGDLVYEPESKFSIGATASYNERTRRDGGQIGRLFETEGLHRNLETYFVDLLFKKKGWSVSAEYAQRGVNGAYFTDGARQVTIYEGRGVNLQLSHVTKNNWQPAVRYTELWATDATLQGDNNRRQTTFGLSKYFNRHLVKLQTDLTFDEEINPAKDTYAPGWIYRLQAEIGI